MNATKNLMVIDSVAHPVPTGTKTLPLINIGYWAFTLESCALHGEVAQAVKAVFRTLPEEYQHAFTFESKPGGWFMRARVWARLLRPVLPDDLYSQAMQELTDCFIRAERLQEKCP